MKITTKIRHWLIKTLGGYIEQQESILPPFSAPPMPPLIQSSHGYTVEALEASVNVARKLSAKEIEFVARQHFIDKLHLGEFIEVRFVDHTSGDPSDGKVMHMKLLLLKKKTINDTTTSHPRQENDLVHAHQAVIVPRW